MAIKQTRIIRGLLVEVLSIAGYALLLYGICLAIEVVYR